MAGERQRRSICQPRVGGPAAYPGKTPSAHQPQRGCSHGERWCGCNPVGVGAVSFDPRVGAPASRQPWADGWNAVGVQMAGKCLTGSGSVWRNPKPVIRCGGRLRQMRARKLDKKCRGWESSRQSPPCRLPASSSSFSRSAPPLRRGRVKVRGWWCGRGGSS